MAAIEDFMSKFYGPTHEYVHQLDPFSTFNITFKFFPCDVGKEKESPGFLDKLAAAATGAVRNAINNATGGLAAAIGGAFNSSISKQHDEYGKAGEYSFMNYLAAATMLDSGEQSLVGGMSGSPSSMLMLNLSEFVQDITVPFLGIKTDEESQTLLGKFPVNGSIVVPDNNELLLTVLNTKLPLLEYIFYPWMREVTLPFWSYQSVPYTTARVTIDFSKHADVQYVFCGCRPKQIQTLQPSNIVDGNALKRQVTMMFDFMFISSKEMKTQPSALDLAKTTGSELLGGAAGMMSL